MRVEDDLKQHNRETIERILEFYKTERKCCAIQATGTGKTFLILCLLEIYNDMDKVAVIFAPNKEIIKQTKKRMKEFGLNNATFFTYQKLARLTDEEISNIQADLIVCDELHRTGANTWGQKFEILVNTHPESKVFGVTATPLRCSDGRDMAEEYFDGNKACNISLAEALVREIIPVMPVYVSALYTFEEEYQNMSNKIDKSRNSQEEKVELQEVLLAAKQQLEKANGVPEIIKKYITNYNGKYIIFCKDKKHLYAMKDVVVGWFRESGYDGKIFEYPYYSNSSAVKKNLENFENNKEEGLKLLFVIDKLNEGLHLDIVDGCILLRTTVSNIIYYQQIGRVIDAGSDEKRVILDLVSNFNSLKSFNLKKELEEKIRERQEGKFAECSVEFELEKFDVVDCVQECADVFNDVDNKINSSTLNNLICLWDIYVRSGYDDNSIEDIVNFKKLKNKWRNNIQKGKVSENKKDILRSHNFPFSYNEEIDQRTQYLINNHTIKELIDDKRIQSIISLYINDNISDNLREFLNKSITFLEILDHYFKNKRNYGGFEYFKDIINLYLNDGHSIDSIENDTLYKDYELGKNFNVYKYRIQYEDFFEKLGVSISKYNQKDRFIYKIELLDECLKNGIIGKKSTYKGENIGDWYRVQRKNYRKGKLSEYKIKEFEKRNIPLVIETVA